MKFFVLRASRLLSIAIACGLAGSAFASDTGQTTPQDLSGSGALALAALVGESAPLPANEKAVLAAFLAGNTAVTPHAGKTITVTADSVTCRASNVDLTDHSCDLVFGKTKASLTGRAAHELYATLVEVGVPSDGAAGTIYEGLSHLSCSVDPAEIASKDGGGAKCRFTPGPP
jgi:hypothetical protein